MFSSLTLKLEVELIGLDKNYISFSSNYKIDNYSCCNLQSNLISKQSKKQGLYCRILKSEYSASNEKFITTIFPIGITPEEQKNIATIESEIKNIGFNKWIQDKKTA